MRLVYSMNSSKKEHATQLGDASNKTMCGRRQTTVVINNGVPTCKVCLRAIQAAISKAAPTRLIKVA
jgi:hypothetical protein